MRCIFGIAAALSVGAAALASDAMEPVCAAPGCTKGPSTEESSLLQLAGKHRLAPSQAATANTTAQSHPFCWGQENLHCVYWENLVFECKDGDLVYCDPGSTFGPGSCVDGQGCSSTPPSPTPSPTPPSPTPPSPTPPSPTPPPPAPSTTTTPSDPCAGSPPLWPNDFRPAQPYSNNDWMKAPPGGISDVPVFLCKNSDCEQVLYSDPSSTQVLWKNLVDVEAKYRTSALWRITSGKPGTGTSSRTIFVDEGGRYANCLFLTSSGSLEAANAYCGGTYMTLFQLIDTRTQAGWTGFRLYGGPQGQTPMLDDVTIFPLTCAGYLSVQDDMTCDFFPMTDLCTVPSSCPSGTQLVTNQEPGCDPDSCTGMACVTV